MYGKTCSLPVYAVHVRTKQAGQELSPSRPAPTPTPEMASVRAEACLLPRHDLSPGMGGSQVARPSPGMLAPRAAGRGPARGLGRCEEDSPASGREPGPNRGLCGRDQGQEPD